MNTFKLDTHIHTYETSSCGKVEAIEAVHLYKESGYNGIAITDHYFREYFDSLESLSWEEKADIFLKGYRTALYEGKKIGLKVILGMEIRFEENINDYLIYGIDENFLKDYKELYNLGLEKFRNMTKNMGIVIFQAHPFRPTMIPTPPSLIDGIEVYNGNPRHDSQNPLARAYAEEHGLKMISGSDFHQLEDLARGGVILPEDVNDSFELAEMLTAGKVKELIVTGYEGVTK